ncbi:MAG TPA: DmsC/YnfH family molybdoenzyme membrane anchor subunit [Candidatus Nanoarchaeia archaeon]|nr:DmsC/YnfH family molybdoenzyme membrane anchor subunit [Candidatus Nanoarchaeia archaeon]
MAEQRSSEWPLVVFTVGIQLSFGVTMATTAIDFFGSRETPSVTALGTLVFPIIASALIGSAFHLGRPFSGWRALSNLLESRLTAEVAVTVVLAASALVYSIACVAGLPKQRLAVGVATLFLAALAVVLSARIYTIKTQPFWAAQWVLSSFVGSALVIGGTVGTWCLSRVTHVQLQNLFTATAVVGALLVLFSIARMMQKYRNLAKTRYAKPCAPSVLTSADRSFIGASALFAGVSPLVLAVTLCSGWGAVTSELAIGILLLALAGVTLGRAAMYSLGTALSGF